MKSFFSSSLFQGLYAEHTIISISKRSYSPSVCCLHCSLQVIDYDWEKKKRSVISSLTLLNWFDLGAGEIAPMENACHKRMRIWVYQHLYKIRLWWQKFVIKALRVGRKDGKLWRFSASQDPIKCQTLGSVTIPRLKKCGLNDWENHLTFISCL